MVDVNAQGERLEIYPDDLHNQIMTQWEKDFGSIHKDVLMSAYTVSGFVRAALKNKKINLPPNQSDNDTRTSN